MSKKPAKRTKRKPAQLTEKERYHRLLRDIIAEHNIDAILFDGCDDAIIGIVRQHGGPCLAVYDYDKLVQVFYQQFRQDRSDEEAYDAAIEWVGTNVESLYAGEHTPLIFHSMAKLIAPLAA